MLTLSNILTPMVSEIGIGGVGGFIVGFAMKKIAKIAAVAIGAGFVFLQYLSYKGVLTIDYTALKEWAVSLMGQAAAYQTLVTDIIIHIPFGSSFIFGLYLGLKKG
ncbi:MAG: FUN14 domain-containing protein [Candidatus Bathyarchaeia archaeon]